MWMNCLRVLLGLACALCTLWAGAHQLPLGLGLVHLRGAQAVVEISVPESAITGLPKQVHFEASDLARHKSLIDLRVAEGMQLQAIRKGSASEMGVWQDIHIVLAPATAQTGAVFHVTGRVEFRLPPDALGIHYALWPKIDASSDDTLKLTVLRFNANTLPDADVALLSQTHPQAKALLPWNEMLAGVLVQGTEHILLGFDHLLFLATLLTAQVAFRRWLMLLTAFTLAHGITFGLAQLGWVSAPGLWVEPAIAASIVLVAILKLVRKPIPLPAESALVFSLGLIHGLGFASAMQIEGGFVQPMLRFPVISILGFNLGVEIGQVIVALTAWLALKTVQSAAGARAQSRVVQGTMVFAALMGSYWFCVRVWAW